MTINLDSLNKHKTTISAAAVALVSIFGHIFPKQTAKVMSFVGMASDHVDDICDLHEDLVGKYGGDLSQILAELPPRTRKVVESIKQIADTAKDDKQTILDKFYNITDQVKEGTELLTDKDLEGLPSHLKKAILSMDERVVGLQKAAETAEHLKEALDIATATDTTYSKKILGVLEKVDQSNDHLTPEDLEGLPSGLKSVLTKMDAKIEHFKGLAEAAQGIESTIEAITTDGGTDDTPIEPITTNGETDTPAEEGV